jgi:PAS domain S-box-containing protein
MIVSNQPLRSLGLAGAPASDPDWPHSYRSNADFASVGWTFEKTRRVHDRLENENVILREQVDRPSDSSLEVRRLQRCMNDLIGVLALPAAWRGCEPVEILSTLVDSLMQTLTLDFLYARATVEAGEKPLEMLRAGPSHRTDEIAQSLDDWLREDQIDRPSQTPRNIGDHEISIFPTRMGAEGDLGFIVAGSQRLSFPEQTEKLILNVAANQAAIGLQHAQLLSEQERVAEELDRRVAERTRDLAETNKELQLEAGLLQHLPASAWTLKPDGTPDFVNQFWLEFSGQTLEFVRSHPEAWMTAVHPEDRETASRAFWNGVRSGQGFAFETRSLRAQDGTYRWHLQQAVVLRDADGKVLKFVGTTTDIDDQKRAEEALSRLRSELAHVARVTSLGALTASIAHEVNQPLTGIVTNSGTCLRMLSADPPNIDGAREAARRAIRDGNRASDVVSRLRALFGKKEVTVEPVDLNEAIREVIALSSSDLQRHRVILQLEFADRLPLLYGDRIQLQQVVLNLLRNASEAMSGIEDRPRRLLIRTEQKGEEVRLSVQDSGVGLAPGDAERLFESFYTTKEDGMGIGLSISRSIIEAHHGRLWATANVDPGATFAFSIPCEQAS